MNTFQEYLEAAKEKKSKLNFNNSGDFIKYLHGTLVPDLRESGSDAMADDYAEAVYWIKDNLKKQQFQHDEAKRTDRNIRDRETQEKKQKAKDKKNWG